MKTTSFVLIFILISLGNTSCLFEEEPANSSTENFETFWNDFDKYYAQFQIRNIDWDSIYQEYEPRINTTTSEQQLFQYLSEIVTFINDVHVNLFTPFGNTSCQTCLLDYAGSDLINPQKYIQFGNPQEHSGFMEFRNMLNNNIGYLNLKTFRNGEEGDEFLTIDEVLKSFKDKKGIIVDLRGNGGGSSANAEIVASRFADQKRLYQTYYEKIGAGEDDFSDWQDVFIEPDGEFQFLKPVVVLTSRRTFSSAESFVMAMQVFSHVTIIGDNTGGGIGNPIFRELANGWSYRLSTKVAALPDRTIVEGVGINPDIKVVTTSQDSIKGIDIMLEKAIEFLK